MTARRLPKKGPVRAAPAAQQSPLAPVEDEMPPEWAEAASRYWDKSDPEPLQKLLRDSWPPPRIMGDVLARLLPLALAGRTNANDPWSVRALSRNVRRFLALKIACEAIASGEGQKRAFKRASDACGLGEYTVRAEYFKVQKRYRSKGLDMAAHIAGKPLTEVVQKISQKN